MVRTGMFGRTALDQVRQNAGGMPGLGKGDDQKIDRGLTYDGMQVTLENFVATWLDGKDLSRAPRTVFQYRKMASEHILPALGKMRLQEIQPIHIRQLYTRKKAEGRGPRTLQYMHAVLHCALEQAVREGILGRNPADAVERPKVAQSEFKILTEEQCHQFLHAAAESHTKHFSTWR